ncbi:MAG TPA: NHLP bacteriocin export ABC transporter permease/ATPase subunit [Stellaceae bacterium]|nr:NHLP bacteriocin export ABC transporter permease/ATPase subunit [Stellaceae bacterium]
MNDTAGGAPPTTAPAGHGDAFEARVLAMIAGERLSAGYHNPFLLEREDLIWLVLQGRVEIYAVPLEGDEIVGGGRHVLTVQPGEVIFGLPAVPMGPPGSGQRLALRAVAVMGTEVYVAPRAQIEARNFDISVVIWVDRWVALLSEALMHHRPLPVVTLPEADPDQSFPSQTALSAQHDDVLWLDLLEGGLRFLDAPEAPVAAGAPLLPLTDRSFARAEGEIRANVIFTPGAWRSGRLWAGFNAFQRIAMTCLERIVAEEHALDAARIERRVAASNAIFDAAEDLLEGLVGTKQKTQGLKTRIGDPLLAAAMSVGEACGIEIRTPRTVGDAPARLIDIARASGCQVRRVALDGEWWREDGEPLLGYVAPTKDRPESYPVALLPSGGAYEAFDALSGGRQKVTPSNARSFDEQAYFFYRPFPPGRLGLRQVVRFGVGRRGNDVLRLLLWGVAAGLVALVPPIVTGYVYGTILPQQDMGSLLALTLALVASAFGSAAFTLTRSLALIRLQSSMDMSIQSAMWDRLLSLPIRFFRRYTAGDLADRVTGIYQIREVMTRSVSDALIGGIFSLFSYGLMFWYLWQLGLVATGIAIVVVGVVAVLTRLQLPHQRAIVGNSGRTDGLVLQMLTAISKLRVSAAESRAFARWAELFAENKRWTLMVRRYTTVQQTLTEVVPVLSSMAIFAYVVWVMLAPDSNSSNNPSSFDFGAYLSFNAALGQFLSGLVGIVNSVSQILVAEPIYRRAAVVLDALPEGQEARSEPGALAGEIEFRNVVFRYEEGAPPAVSGMSFHIKPGEFVAFAGPSGAGKSTIARLLLGIETPESGTVLVDGLSLSSLDAGAVRRQIGVVLQAGRPLAGSIFENIIGSLPLTIDDAWYAATQAGLADDIRAMPMGMQTVLTDGATTLSGGQRQRLMIARALVGKPRILVFDEATSALDNRTQQIVNESLAQLNMTRIVIAHRLSTIQHAHRIHVVRDGHIVESGRFEELMALNGEFAALARRQML